jgi:hypothetical protein
LNSEITPIVAGLAVGIAFIVLFSTIGTSAISHYTRYDLGTKDELISKLSEYLAREPGNAVKIPRTHYSDASIYDGVHDVYGSPLISEYDQKEHGTLRIFTYHNDTRVQSVSVTWQTRDQPYLVSARDLLISALADNTIPDWQANDDGQPNRNMQMLEWVHTNTDDCSGRVTVKDDLIQQRKLYVSGCHDNISFLRVSVEP